MFVINMTLKEMRYLKMLVGVDLNEMRIQWVDAKKECNPATKRGLEVDIKNAEHTHDKIALAIASVTGIEEV